MDAELEGCLRMLSNPLGVHRFDGDAEVGRVGHVVASVAPEFLKSNERVSEVA